MLENIVLSTRCNGERKAMEKPSEDSLAAMKDEGFGARAEHKNRLCVRTLYRI